MFSYVVVGCREGLFSLGVTVKDCYTNPARRRTAPRPSAAKAPRATTETVSRCRGLAVGLAVAAWWDRGCTEAFDLKGRKNVLSVTIQIM